MDFSEIKLNGFIIKKVTSKLDLESLLELIRKAGNKNNFAQVFDPKSIINEMHLVGAYTSALFAFENGVNKTDSIAMEMLLFAAMTDQIGRAISISGAKTASDILIFSNNALVFNKIRPFLSEESNFKPDARHIKKAARALGIKTSKKNIDILILERIALSRLGPD
jgi:tRNA threonylcarbamoyladenosine modification (KEOPS) complex Cgi121 subunit